VLPEISALLWIVPVAFLCSGAFSIGALVFPSWNDRWLCLLVYAALLLLPGMFLRGALLHPSVQIGLWMCLLGWLLSALGALLGFMRTVSDPIPTEAAPAHPTRRAVLRGLVGIVGLASVGGTGGFLLWKTWRTHTAITTYQFRDPVTGQISSGGPPDFNSVLSVEWSSDGKRILVAQLHAPPQSWDALTGNQRQTYQPAEATAAAWSPDGRQIALSQDNYPERPFLVVRSTTTGAQTAALSLENRQMHGVARFAWSPDSRSLALADTDELLIKLWNPTTGAFGATCTIPAPDQFGDNRVQDLAWSPDGQYLAATIPLFFMLPDGTLDRTPRTTPGLSGVYVWHLQSGTLLVHQQAAIPSHGIYGRSLLSWSPDGRRLAFAHKTMVQVLDLALQKPVLAYTGHVLTPLAVDWSPGGAYLASGGVDQTIQVWEAATGTQRFLYQGHQATVNDIAWSPDGAYLVSGSDDGTARVWQPQV
jgi:WD40 repeat protein